MTRCLFVGGPEDGTWHDVDTSAPTWQVHTPAPMPSLHFSAETPAWNHESYAVYKPVDFHFGHREIFIYQHVEMHLDPLGLLHHLCMGYSK